MAQYITQVLSSDPELRPLLQPPTILSVDEIPASAQPSLFILDTYLLALDLASLIQILKARSPNGKLLALLDPRKTTSADMVRLLYLGVQGLVQGGENLTTELPLAIHEILTGNLWVPPQIFAEYVKSTNVLLERLYRPEQDLTPRENQILVCLIRRLTNKEIAESLGISERTVKFHVSNMLAKLRLDNRSDLRTALGVAA